jgi:hypothetical protein
MRRNLIDAGYRFVAVLVLFIGLSAYGCKDTTSISEEVEVPLSSLTVTPGSLQPAFFSNTTNYGVNAPTSATSVTVTAVPKASTDTVTINGVTTASGQGRSIPLGDPGSVTTIVIVVFSQTGNETTYTVNVTRLLSDDNNLSALSVRVGNATQPLVPGFNASILDYTVSVGNADGQVTVSATKSDQGSTMVISSGASSVTILPGVNQGQLPVTLGSAGTATPVTIEVTAPNGSKKTYRVTVNRLSGENTLSDLKVTDADTSAPLPLSPAFLPAVGIYTVDVPTRVSKVTVTATKSDPNAAMTGHITAGAGIPTGTVTLDLGPPGPEVDNDVFITVAAPDPNVVPKEYRITLRRAALSSNADLSNLSVVPGLLDPQPFDANILAYTVINVPTGDTIVFVTATKSDPNATLSSQGSVIAPPGVPDAVVPVSLGSTVEIKVIAENTLNSKTYTITFTFNPPPPPPSP